MKPTPKLLADWCTLLMNGYQAAAADYRRDPSALNQQVLNAATICLHNVAKAVPVLLPEIWPKLRLVNPQALWHADPQFPWDEAEKELRTIQAAALRCDDLAPIPTKDTATKNKTGGRRRKWDDFYRLACEILKANSDTSWDDIAAKHNRRFSSREHLTGKKARKIYSDYRKREQNHD